MYIVVCVCRKEKEETNVFISCANFDILKEEKRINKQRSETVSAQTIHFHFQSIAKANNETSESTMSERKELICFLDTYWSLSQCRLLPHQGQDDGLLVVDDQIETKFPLGSSFISQSDFDLLDEISLEHLFSWLEYRPLYRSVGDTRLLPFKCPLRRVISSVTSMTKAAHALFFSFLDNLT